MVLQRLGLDLFLTSSENSPSVRAGMRAISSLTFIYTKVRLDK